MFFRHFTLSSNDFCVNTKVTIRISTIFYIPFRFYRFFRGFPPILNIFRNFTYLKWNFMLFVSLYRKSDDLTQFLSIKSHLNRPVPPPKLNNNTFSLLFFKGSRRTCFSLFPPRSLSTVNTILTRSPAYSTNVFIHLVSLSISQSDWFQ